MRKSRTLAKLRAGKVALGANVSLGVSLITPGLAGKLGMDFVWIDMEHRPFSFNDAAMMILSAREGGVDPMIRLRDKQSMSFYRCFELGTCGVMVPHCRSRAEAEHAVYNSKFHPIGGRGMENVMIDGEFGTVPWPEFSEWHNRESFVVVQIEDRESLDVLDDIASTPGLDALFIGPGDLSQSFGKPGEGTGCDEVMDAVKKVSAACEKHGIYWGLPVPSDPDAMKRFVDMGARFMVPFGDYRAVLQTWQREMETACEMLAQLNLD